MFTNSGRGQRPKNGGGRAIPTEKTLRETFSHGWILYTLFGAVVKIFIVKTCATSGSAGILLIFGRGRPQPFEIAEENPTRIMRQSEIRLVFLSACNIV